MILHIFVVADNYEDSGYALRVVQDHETWRYQHFLTEEDSFLLDTVDIAAPSSDDLVQIGLTKVKNMEDSLADHIDNAQRQIKEYESKFIRLDAPETEELS